MSHPNDYSYPFTLNGLTVANDGTADGDQTWFASIDGWESCPRRVVTLPNVTDDGDVPVDLHLAARPLTISGIVQVNSSDPTLSLENARRRFMAAVLVLPDALATLTVQERNPSTYAMVHSSVDAPEWDRQACDDADSVGIAIFQAGLIVPGGAVYDQATVSTALSAGIAVPVATAAASTSGGTLGATVYAYRVSAVNGSGETAASPETLAFLAPLPTPGKPTLTAGFGGTLANVSTQAYRVSAVNAAGETLASAEAVISHGGSAGSSTAITVAWSPVSGAVSYNVYGRTVGSELKIATAVVGTSFVDTGAVTPSGALPSSNTTGTTTGSVTITWPAVTGATGYNVYGRTPAGELKMTSSPTASLTFTDDGSVTPSGALPASGFSAMVTNAGNYRTKPVLTVAGAATNPIALTIGTRTLRLNVAVAGGHTLVADCLAKTITLDGVSRMDVLDNASEWPALAPGANAVGYSGGGTPSLDHHAAYA